MQTTYYQIIDYDIDDVRGSVQMFAQEMGFDKPEQECLVTVAQELAYHMLFYARGGYIILDEIAKENQQGIMIQAIDEGIDKGNLRAFLKGKTISLGCIEKGLFGIREMMDTFNMVTSMDKGSIITTKKWL